MVTRVPIVLGGTGAANAADARANLGVLSATGNVFDEMEAMFPSIITTLILLIHFQRQGCIHSFLIQSLIQR